MKVSSAGVGSAFQWKKREKRSKALDVVVGIALPITLLVYDPCVFHGFFQWEEEAFLGKYRGACYVIVACCMAALALWLTTKRWPALCAGALWSGTLFAAALSIALLPLSILGTFFMGIGLVGLMPFWIAYIYWRNAKEASNLSVAGRRRVLQGLTGFALVVAAGAGTHLAVSLSFQRGVEQALADDSGEREAGVALLQRVLPWRDMDELFDLWQEESDPARQQKIGEVYASVLGVPPESFHEFD